ncbi:Novel nucleolar protein 2 [Carabus blaptoides fortunei]
MADISKDDLRKEITAILKDADLATMSAKKVRQQLEQKLDCDLLSRKKEIDDLVMEFVNSKEKKKSKKKNDSEEEDEEEEEVSEEEEDSEEDKKPAKRGAGGKKPAAKKAKKATSEESEASEGSDAESDEEYSPKKTKPIKTRKLPPKKKKGSESDSDEEWSKTKKPKKGDMMARHEVVKKIWAIIKERNLYDPKNKQYAICDDDLMKVIGVKRFRTFGMMKYLKTHFVD